MDAQDRAILQRRLVILTSGAAKFTHNREPGAVAQPVDQSTGQQHIALSPREVRAQAQRRVIDLHVDVPALLQRDVFAARRLREDHLLNCLPIAALWCLYSARNICINNDCYYKDNSL